MNATLFCCLTRRPAAFLAIWGGQPKAQPPFLNFKGQPSLLIIVGLAAALRVLCRAGGSEQPVYERAANERSGDERWKELRDNRDWTRLEH